MAMAVMAPAAPAYADNLHGFGCGTGAGTTMDATSTPGNSATSPGSPKNEPGINSPSGGTGGQAYNNARQGAGAPSNYDTSCGRVTANGTGTPMQTTPSATDFTNNSKATRPISHTGNGLTK
ncbi:MAG TPA: hypothetical protein VFW21_08330 [Mycobacterium sp.]|nr:hypothetical protein [Mycobacterium sp.]